MNILLLADEKPGHYHLAEGVIAAIARLTDVNTTRIRVKRRKAVPARLLRKLLLKGWTSPPSILRLGFGLSPQSLGSPDLVISAGGETLIANIAAARLVGAANIFCGSLRNIPPENLSLVVTSYSKYKNEPNNLVTLKPSLIDPDALGSEPGGPVVSEGEKTKTIGVLVGGNSGLFKYTQEEWTKLLAFIRDLANAMDARFLISNSRRTSPHVSNQLTELSKDKTVVENFIDYRKAGPGTLQKIFAAADMIICTEDSSSMISEAICARLPVIGVSPKHHDFKAEENDYRQMMVENNWCRNLPIAELDIEGFQKALSEIKPMKENHLDRLAAELQKRLPILQND